MILFDTIGLSRRLDPIYLEAGVGGIKTGPTLTGDDGGQYTLELVPVPGGTTLSWRCISPVILAVDGNTYRLKLVYADGEMVLDWTLDPGATPGDFFVYDHAGNAYRLALVYADDGVTLTLDWTLA